MFKRGWEPGQATIVARRDSKGLAALRDTQYGRSWSYDYVVDVRPDSGAPVFRATFTVHFSDSFRSGGRRPLAGEQARVFFDPRSHEVEFDRDALRAEKVDAAETVDDAFEAASDGAPGSRPPQEPSPLSEQMERINASVTASQSTTELLAAIMRAKEAGDTAEVARLKAEFLARRDAQGS
jgi:hypothetical protein